MGNSRGFIRRYKFLHRPALYIWNIPSRVEESYRHHKTDCYLISFPKCGRTWLRLIIGKYIEERFKLQSVPKADILELTPLSKYNSEIPLIQVTHDDRPDLKKPAEIEKNKKKYRKKKVLFLVRDPRDVVVSQYFQLLKRERKIEEIGISEFIRLEKGSLNSIIRFYNVWYENREIPKDFLIVKYEDLHTQFYKEKRLDELTRILKYIGFEHVDMALLSLIAKYAAFDNMKKLERRGEFESEYKRLNPIDEDDDESYKTRRGKIGGYHDYCDKKDIVYMDRLIEEDLNDYYQY